MYIDYLYLNNFTVFKTLNIEFSKGVNIFIGENGTGKTHLLKLLYAACKAAEPQISFPQKLVNCMLPDNYQISRLVNRDAKDAKIVISAEEQGLEEKVSTQLHFSKHNKKWNATVDDEEEWEQKLNKSNAIFIPAKEILSNCYNLGAAVAMRNVKFDDTYIDVINAAKIVINRLPENGVIFEANGGKLLDMIRLENIIGGRVIYDEQTDSFYIKNKGKQMEFNLLAEGIRKLALVLKLIQNGAIDKHTVLFWDEPDANMNPSYISMIAHLLLCLQKEGVQIFLSTHNYMLAKYFEVLKDDSDTVLYHSLYKTEQGIGYECGEAFDDLKNNAIINSFDKLLDEIYDMGVSKHE